jgi:hypothetical protein
MPVQIRRQPPTVCHAPVPAIRMDFGLQAPGPALRMVEPAAQVGDARAISLPLRAQGAGFGLQADPGVVQGRVFLGEDPQLVEHGGDVARHADPIGLGMVGLDPLHGVLDVKGPGCCGRMARTHPAAFQRPHGADRPAVAPPSTSRVPSRPPALRIPTDADLLKCTAAALPDRDLERN